MNRQAGPETIPPAALSMLAHLDTCGRCQAILNCCALVGTRDENHPELLCSKGRRLMAAAAVEHDALEARARPVN